MISFFYAVLNEWAVSATPKARNPLKLRSTALDSPACWIVQNK
ncbi:hypothetical protein NIES2104_60440 [Leptolyngbya sp. NIES-2104]|nr:hypothetical protein NIES2104_60440 [Leptolyngbya sp. NIES-2104]